MALLEKQPCRGWCKERLPLADMVSIPMFGLFCRPCGERVLRERQRMICTKAERAVLDAMTALRTEWLQDMLRSDRCFPNEPTCAARVVLHVAELARRGLK